MIEKKDWPKKSIIVSINGNKTDGFTFLYTLKGSSEQTCEQLIITEASYLQYIIDTETDAYKNYQFKFASVAFTNPFNSIITDAEIKNNGNEITLEDPFEVNSKNSELYTVDFQFCFSFTDPSTSKEKNLLLLSADPQVVNHGDETCPPPVKKP